MTGGLLQVHDDTDADGSVCQNTTSGRKRVTKEPKLSYD